MSKLEYAGKELDLFGKACNWKKYYGSFIKPYFKNRLLEVGAGMGKTTLHLCNGSQDKWFCLEPDIKLAEKIEFFIKNKNLPDCCEVIRGTLSDIPEEELFDTIIYIDVIEHIEDDVKELELAAQHLTEGGILIIVAPAHQWLYSEFDKAVGHHRRYNKKMLKAIIPSKMEEKKLIYIDSMGLCASAANKLLLRQNCPTEKQILFWDRVIIKISRYTDILFAYSMGKSILGIWEKP